MDVLGALGGQFVLFALSLVLMQASLRWGRLKGLFAALPLGLLPSLALAALTFWQIQQKDLPEIKEARQAYVVQGEQLATQVYPKPDDSADRDAFRALWSKLFEVSPACEFCVYMGLLAALAVVLRQALRQSGALMPAPEAALGRWTAPLVPGLASVLGPAAVLLVRAKGLVELDSNT